MWHMVIIITLVPEYYLSPLWTHASGISNLKIITEPKDYFPKSGNLQLVCEAAGDPSPNIIWYNEKTNSPIDEDKSLDVKIYNDGGHLFIHNPKERQTYSLFCNVSNSKQWIRSKTVKAGLSYLSEAFMKQPQSIIVIKKSQTATLSCQLPKGNPFPKSNWFKDHKPILTEKINEDLERFFFTDLDHGNNNNNKNYCSLQIKNAKFSDTGKYQSVATNEFYTSKSRTTWLLVMESFNDKILDIKIKHILRNVGEDVEMLCKSNNKKAIKWISSKELSSYEESHMYDRRLVKRNLKLDDRGLYACETNETNSRLLNVFNLSVVSIDHSSKKMKIQKKVVLEGFNVNLECDLEKTKAEFYWETPQSHPIFPNDYSQPRFRVTKDGYLNIISAQSSDSGKYTCNVHSALDVKHRSIWLEVSKHQLDIYPIISLPAQNLTVTKGSNINLRCEVIGEDIINILWYIGLNFKERLIKDWQISFPNKESILIIDAERKRNTNFYTCEAINEHGLKSSWTAFVNVIDNQTFDSIKGILELPIPPVVEPPKNVKSSSLELVWSSNYNANTQISYWIEYVYFGSKNGWEIYKKEWPQNFITVENLKPDTWYQFLVRSKHRGGIGRASVPTEYVKTKNFMSDEPYSGNVGFQFDNITLTDLKIVNGHQIKISWILNRNDNDNDFKSTFYTQFYLNYKPVSIIDCIMDKSNENIFESLLISSLKDHCSLRAINTDNLQILRYNFSPKNQSSLQIPIDFQKINISKFHQSHIINYAQISWLIDNASFFHCYNISVSSKSEYRYIHSNHKLIITPESNPSRPPEDIHISWMLPNLAVNVKSKLPDQKYWNGILTGIKVYMKSNESEIIVRFNDTQSNKVISNVNPNLNWLFQLTLENCIGESNRSDPILLHKLSDTLLDKSGNIFSTSQKMNVFKKSWMIATLIVTSLLICLMLSFLILYLCCSKSFRFNEDKFFGKSNDIANNKDFKDEFIVNPIHDIKKDNNFYDNDNNKIFNINNLSLSPTSSNSLCNPYASTQIFEPLCDKRICDTGTDFSNSNLIESENMNLYYLSSPIFDNTSINTAAHNSMNYYLSNPQEWLHNNASNLSPYSVYGGPPDCVTNPVDLHFDKSSSRKDQSVELTVLKNNSTINNFLLSSAPFSDPVNVSLKSKSTNNSSNSDSSHHPLPNDHISRLKKSTIQSKSNKRRHDSGDILFDHSTEMTHLLANLPDKSSPFHGADPCQVYDIPYSDSLSMIDRDH